MYLGKSLLTRPWSNCWRRVRQYALVGLECKPGGGLGTNGPDAIFQSRFVAPSDMDRVLLRLKVTFNRGGTAMVQICLANEYRAIFSGSSIPFCGAVNLTGARPYPFYNVVSVITM